MKKCDHPKCGQAGIGHFTIRGVRVNCPVCQGTGELADPIPEAVRIVVQPSRRKSRRVTNLTLTNQGDLLSSP